MAAMKWDTIQANIGTPSESMRNAMSGISQAGTIFGDLRKQILDQEQRDVENAFRERQIAQQAEQFGLTHGLAKEQFGETKRSNVAEEQYKKDALKQAFDIAKLNDATTRYGYNLTDARGREANALARESFIFSKGRTERADKEADNIQRETAWITGAMYSDNPEALKQELQQQRALVSTKSEEKVIDTRLKFLENRGNISGPIGSRNAVNAYVAQITGNKPLFNVFDDPAKEQIAAIDNNFKRSLEANQVSEKYQSELLSAQGKMPEDYRLETQQFVDLALVKGVKHKDLAAEVTRLSQIPETRFATDAATFIREWNNSKGTKGMLAEKFGTVEKEPNKSPTGTPDSTKENKSSNVLNATLLSTDEYVTQFNKDKMEFLKQQGFNSEKEAITALESKLQQEQPRYYEVLKRSKNYPKNIREMLDEDFKKKTNFENKFIIKY